MHIIRLTDSSKFFFSTLSHFFPRKLRLRIVQRKVVNERVFIQVCMKQSRRRVITIADVSISRAIIRVSGGWYSALMRLTSVTQLNMKQVTEERATYYPSSRLIIRCVIHVDMFLTYEMVMIKSNGSIIIMNVIT